MLDKLEIMDDVSATSQHDKEIGKQTGAIFLLVVSLYLIISENGFDLFAFFVNWISKYISNQFAFTAVQIIAAIIANGLVYAVVNRIVTFVYCYSWRKKHKQLWVKGLWLHIHDKKKPRIGVVKIEQNFYSLKVRGHNIDPLSDGSADTAWNYMMGSVLDDSNRDFVLGYYQADRGLSSKDGIHRFRIEYTSDDTYPNAMIGTFRDVVRDTHQDVSDSIGDIFLFRLTKDSPYYDRIIDPKTGNIRYTELARLHQDAVPAGLEDAYRNDPYLKKLADVLVKRCSSDAPEL